MKHILSLTTAFAGLAMIGTSLLTTGCKTIEQEKDIYLFTSHREPALDGLHFLYSEDALHWDSLPGVWLKAQVGNDKPYIDAFTGKQQEGKYMPEPMMRDPSLCYGPDGKYHLAWTTGWAGTRGFGYAESKDLIHWSKPKEIKVMEDNATNNVWAPEIFYDDVLQQYMIVFSSAIHPSKWTAADRQGTNSVHRCFYTTTRDFRTFSPTKAFYDPGFNCIDAFVLKRDKGEYVAILKDNRKPGYSDLYSAFAPTAEGPYRTLVDVNSYADPKIAPGTNPGDSLKLQGHFAPEYSEGACAVKVGDWWHIYFDVYRQNRYGAVRTKDFQTYESLDDKVSFPMGHKHGTIVKISRKQLDKMLKHASKRK